MRRFKLALKDWYTLELLGRDKIEFLHILGSERASAMAVLVLQQETLAEYLSAIQLYRVRLLIDSFREITIKADNPTYAQLKQSKSIYTPQSKMTTCQKIPEHPPTKSIQIFHIHASCGVTDQYTQQARATGSI